MMRLTVGLVLGATVLIGCATDHPNPRPQPAAEMGERSMLAGLWDYEEGTVVVVLTLDGEGNGEYLYQGGRFETTSLQGRVWRGRWRQAENDREGEFEVTLSASMTEGDGRWWYTRIGRNLAPGEKGGAFHLSRSNSTPPSKAVITRPKGETHGE